MTPPFSAAFALRVAKAVFFAPKQSKKSIEESRRTSWEKQAA
jgi:hypothetical protein